MIASRSNISLRHVLRVALRARDANRLSAISSVVVAAGHETLLTPRELEVLTAISEGLGNKAIAGRLDISLHTVKFHIESIFRKLGARTRAEAVAKGWDRNRGAIEL